MATKNIREKGASKNAPAIGDTIKFRRILRFVKHLEPLFHLSILCSKVELNIFASSVLINETVPDNNTFLESIPKIRLLQVPEPKEKQELVKRKGFDYSTRDQKLLSCRQSVAPGVPLQILTRKPLNKYIFDEVLRSDGKNPSSFPVA